MATRREVEYSEDFESFEVGERFQPGISYKTPSGLMLNLIERAAIGFFPADMQIRESEGTKWLCARVGRPHDQPQMPATYWKSMPTPQIATFHSQEGYLYRLRFQGPAYSMGEATPHTEIAKIYWDREEPG